MSVQSDEATRTGTSIAAFTQALLDHLRYTQGKNPDTATTHDYYTALAHTVRDRLMAQWLATRREDARTDVKTVYYFSAEYLLGRQLGNNLLNLGLEDIARAALATFGQHLDAVRESEVEPGLGNGGLGRLAACYLDSLASLRIPAMGYSIRYEFGIFKQVFADGWQMEQPDNWLVNGYPWEVARPEDRVEIGFGGHTEWVIDDHGAYAVRWLPDYRVAGVPYTVLAPGYRNGAVNPLRLWSAQATDSFDLQRFNAGDYLHAVESKTRSENITKVLYPDDSTPQGKQLRLQQQYFFVACSLQDIIRTFRAQHDDWRQFPDHVAIQLNDTHPTIAIAELMRLLVDEYAVAWNVAWEITRATFSFTSHTLLPEASEQWPVSLLHTLLPRHLEIIYEINSRFLDDVRRRFPDDLTRCIRMSIIAETPEKRVRLVHLACVGSHAINGVAGLQSHLLRDRELRDFSELWPDKFLNVTNGVTPRRFVRLANPDLSALLTETLGNGWLTDLDQLTRLRPYADDAAFRDAWRQIKQRNKRLLAEYIGASQEIAVNPATVFDAMVKRLHEYKRQLLKALHIIALYRRLKADPHAPIVPQAFIFGAKAAPGYRMAKLIIKLINAVGTTINNDPAARNRLTVVFVPNFDVSLGERIYPAADIAEQISLAGMEASGTGNMKFALNGAVTVGTLDGANIEIRDRVGADNFFLFGMTSDEVSALRTAGYRSRDYYERDDELRATLDTLTSGIFTGGDTEVFRPIVDALLGVDQYMVLAEFRAYVTCADAAAHAYSDTDAWVRKSIMNTAGCGFFSSDRAIREYNDHIWHAAPVTPLGIGGSGGSSGPDSAMH